MKLILLSGGSGKRLWPLSNEIRSKQIIKMLFDENGIEQSMVQRVYHQIKQSQPNADIVVATGIKQADSIRNQLGDKVDIVLEPERRDTYPAIALAGAYLAYEKGTDLDETVVVIPVDPYVDTNFFEVMNQMDVAVQTGNIDIVLMGIKPDEPSCKYGYIVPNGMPNAFGVMHVDRFIEKPDVLTAKALLGEHAAWNSGVFAFKLRYLLNAVKKELSFSSFDEIYDSYNLLENTSFDYKIVENCSSIGMIQYYGEWKDIGTWPAISDVVGNNVIGNVVIDNCDDTNVINEMNVPMVVLGAKKMMIVASPDGILVSDKTMSENIKQYVDYIDMKPMYKDKRWGKITVIGHGGDDEMQYLTRHLVIHANMSTSYHCHFRHSIVWTLVKGEAEAIIDDVSQNLLPGDTITIEPGQYHGIKTVKESELIEVQVGDEDIEADLSERILEW
ncbi:Alginate biosynthesis protein AlgA [bioreactor metagenome]|uniref:Alginate biosynthesis protein AlgA n=1 Tax=bioreactor metagenome TaxID=1076179 RepID=A0A645BE20_9ZZZZ